MSDFNYSKSGALLTIYPNNDEAVVCYNEIVKVMGFSKFNASEFKSIRSQLRAAGYTMTKAKPVTKKHLADILENDPLGLLLNTPRFPRVATAKLKRK